MEAAQDAQAEPGNFMISFYLKSSSNFFWMNTNFTMSFGSKFNPHGKWIANSLTEYFKGTPLPHLEI